MHHVRWLQGFCTSQDKGSLLLDQSLFVQHEHEYQISAGYIWLGSEKLGKTRLFFCARLLWRCCSVCLIIDLQVQQKTGQGLGGDPVLPYLPWSSITY